jgi:hypothetical protein
MYTSAAHDGGVIYHRRRRPAHFVASVGFVYLHSRAPRRGWTGFLRSTDKKQPGVLELMLNSEKRSGMQSHGTIAKLEPWRLAAKISARAFPFETFKAPGLDNTRGAP